jgi:uncharacterized protein
VFRHLAELRPRTLYLLVGLLAGFQSALFGVGGGVILVPALIIAAGLTVREAAGSSLVAIGITAALGTAAYEAFGAVDWAAAALIAAPALMGTFVGAWAQQRLSPTLFTALFALFLIGMAIRLLI